VSDWSEFGVREGMSISARSPVREIPEVAQFFGAFLEENDALLAEPFRGVTTDGVVAAPTRSRTGMATEAAVMQLVDRLGFDAVDAGSLEAGAALGPDGPVFGVAYSAGELSNLLWLEASSA
jgi:hypothetical protein